MFVKKNLSHGRIYLNFVEGYTENGKSKHRVIEPIGYLDELEKIYDDPYEHFREIAKERTEQAKKEPLNLNLSKKMTLGTDDLRYLGYFPFKKLYGELKLPTYFRNLQRNYKITYSLNSVYLFLVLSRIMMPGSVEASFNKRRRFFEKFDFSLKQVYRAYDYFFENKDLILKKLYENVAKIYHYKTDVCRLDITNYYYEIRYNDEDEVDENGEVVKEGLRKKGVSKEHRKTPITQMGLLVDGNNIPMGYHLFAGNKSEKIVLRPFLREMKSRFDAGRIIVVADRGINTESNCGYLANGSGDGYIYGNSIRKEDEKFKEWVLDQSDYIEDELEEINPKTGLPIIFKHKSKTEFVTKKLKDQAGRDVGETMVKEKVLVYYSPKYANKEKKEREKTLEKSKHYVKKPSDYGRAINKGAAKYVKEEGEETGKKRKRKLTLDIERIKEEEKYDGYFSIITSEVEMSDKELRDAYKQLWEIEETFKITKEELKTRPVYMTLQEHIEVHFMICYTALLFIRLFEYQCEHKFSDTKFLRSLRNYNCGYLGENYYQNLYYDDVIDFLAKHYDLTLNLKFMKRNEIKHILKY